MHLHAAGSLTAPRSGIPCPQGTACKVHPLPLETPDCRGNPPSPSFLLASLHCPNKRTSALPDPPGTSDQTDRCCTLPRPARSTLDRNYSPSAMNCQAVRTKTQNSPTSPHSCTKCLLRTGCKALLLLPRTHHRRCNPPFPSSPQEHWRSPHKSSSAPPVLQDTIRSTGTPGTLPRPLHSTPTRTCSPFAPSFLSPTKQMLGTPSLHRWSRKILHRTFCTALLQLPCTPHDRCNLPSTSFQRETMSWLSMQPRSTHLDTKVQEHTANTKVHPPHNQADIHK